MTERYDRNGIRILDPQGVNHLKKKRNCLPDEHDWQEVRRDTNVTLAAAYNRHVTTVDYRCEICGDTMSEDRERP